VHQEGGFRAALFSLNGRHDHSLACFSVDLMSRHAIFQISGSLISGYFRA